jgi:hypothetical protein
VAKSICTNRNLSPEKIILQVKLANLNKDTPKVCKKMKQFFLIIALMTLATSAFSVERKLYKDHDGYKIFFTAFNSSFLSPEIAASNDIVRGRGKGMVNISVMEELAIGVPSSITGRVFNILQQSQKLEFFPIREGKSLYYLAPFTFENEDYLTFKIIVQVNDGKSSYPYDFKFQKKMYHD